MSIERFLNNLPDTVTPRQIRALRGGNRRVERWVHSITKPTEAETDWDHVKGLFSIADEVRTSYPALALSLHLNKDLPPVEQMFLIHDLGELIVGDLARSDPDRPKLLKEHKQRERAGFERLVEKYITDDNLKRQVQSVYYRFVDLDYTDTEALFAHFVDKVQAARFGLEHVFGGEVLEEIPQEDREAARIEQIVMSADQILEFGFPLLNQLKLDARSQLSAFMQIELAKYAKAGYKDVYYDAIRKFFAEPRKAPNIH